MAALHERNPDSLDSRSTWSRRRSVESALATRTTIVDAAQFTPALLEGQFDGSAAAWKDAERDRVLLFSQPYLENRLVLVGRQRQ